MKFVHSKSWDNFETIFDSKLPIEQSWAKIISFHENVAPKPYWGKLKQLDIKSEQLDIQNWLEQLVTDSPIPENILALWIGIVKLVDNNKEVNAIYLTGSGSYDEDDIDWATEPMYEPENRYVIVRVLNEIDEVIVNDNDGDYSFLDWILPLAYCAMTFDDIIRTKLNKKLFLNSNAKLFVSLGHDSGDYKGLSAIQ